MFWRGSVHFSQDMPTESSSSALKAFEDGGRKHVDCQALLENSFRTFSMLERWEKAESIVPSVTAIILRVRQQGRDYFETLNDSISVAIKLYELAQDSVQLVGFLLDPEQKTGEIQEFIAEMRAYTHAAVEKSKYISTKCRKVRKGVNEITSIIPNEMEKLERREQRLVLKTESVQRRIERAKIVKTVSAAALAVVSGVATFVFPPMLLILPVGLPIAILALEAYEHRSSRALMKRRDEILDCQAGLRELDEITMGLTGLARHIDSLTEFWVRSDTMLETIYNGVHRMRDNTARLRLATIMNGWERAAEVYMDYAAKLKTIQEIECEATASLRSSSLSARDSAHSSRNALHRSRDRQIVPSVALHRRKATGWTRHGRPLRCARTNPSEGSEGK